MKIAKFRTALIAAVCTALVLVVVAPAGAANYCVGSVPACTDSPQPEYSFDRAGVAAAVTASNGNPGDDTIYIAEGTIDLPSVLTVIAASGQGLEIVGAGRGKTIFRSAQVSSIPMQFQFQTAASTVRGFSLEIYGSPSQVVAVSVRVGVVSDFEVSETGGSASNFRGVSVGNGARAEHGSVTTNSASAVGVIAQTGNGSASDLTLTGGGSGQGVSVSTTGTIDLSRMKIVGFNYGLHMDGGTLSVRDSEINMGAGSNARGLSTFNANNGTTPLNVLVERVTIVGSGNNQRALWFGADSPGEDFVGVFKDLLIYGTGSGFESGRCVGGGGSNTVDFFSWAANVAPTATGECSFDLGTRYDLAANNPRFRDLAAGDLRLRGDSPLIDMGGTDGEGQLDLRGMDRMVDGDDNTVEAVDFGAYEYQRQAPAVTLTAAKSQLAPLETTTFTAEATDVDGEELSYAWSVDDVVSPTTDAQFVAGFAGAGTHTVAVTVTDEIDQSATSSVQVTVVAPPVTGPSNPTGPSTPTCPAVSYAGMKVAVKPKRSFKRGRRGFRVVKKAKQPFLALKTTAGGSYGLRLSSVKGKKLTQLAGSQTVKLKSGTTRLVFGGGWNKKTLKKGTYRLSIVPAKVTDCNAKVVHATVTLKVG